MEIFSSLMSDLWNKIKNHNYKPYIKLVKQKGTELKEKLQEEKRSLDKNLKSEGKTPTYSAYYEYMKNKTKDSGSKIYDTLKNTDYKENAKILKDNAKILSEKAQVELKHISKISAEKIKEYKLDEKLQNINEKGKEYVENLHLKDKIDALKSKGAEKAKVITEKTSEKIGEIGDLSKVAKKRVFEKVFKVSKNVVLFSLSAIFLFSFGKALPTAYFDYKKFLVEQERLSKIQEADKEKKN